jgi:uncharacterized protein DUF6000
MTAGDVRYRALLHGNFAALGGPERTEFLRQLGDAAKQVTDQELGDLLDGDWRSRITAAWLIGTSRREQFRRRIGELLLESQVTFAGQGYCVALALFGTGADADILEAYLDRYLRQPGLRYDQDWAIGALLHIDDTRFARLEGLWRQWSAATPVDPAEQKQRIGVLCALVREVA